MRCKTKQREGSRSANAPEKFGVIPRVSSHYASAVAAVYDRRGAAAGGPRKRVEINDHPVASATDKIRLIAIETEGAFGNERALPVSG